MSFLIYLILILSSMLGIIWWQSRPTDEDLFIQNAGTQQLKEYLNRRSRAASS